MWYVIIIVSVVLLVGLFILTNINYKNNKKDKPLLRTDEDVEGYEKPMEVHPPTIDFDDAE